MVVCEVDNQAGEIMPDARNTEVQDLESQILGIQGT